MDSDMTLMQEKIDKLTAQVESQQTIITRLEASQNGDSTINEKLDTILDHLVAQQRRQQDMEDLKNDVLPIANHFVKLTIDELEEIGSDFQLEDLLFLLKRLLRDTHLLVELLNTMESTFELVTDLQPIGIQAFNQAVYTLDRMEREGFFTFAQGGWRIVERVVAEFDEDDINALGENIVTILKTVRNMTQPEVMAIANQSVDAIREEPPIEGDVSMFTLLRDLNDPKVRKGMARMLNLVKALADQPTIEHN